MKQTKARVEDVLHATKAAADGRRFCPVAAWPCSAAKEAVERSAAPRETKSRRGHRLWRPSAPIKQIASNSGIDGGVVADEVAQKAVNIGYAAYAGKYVDMFKAGIIDPLKVVRTALQNAASIAGLLLTTETLVTDLEKDDKKRVVEGAVR